jgi:hypothetical protein
LSCRARRVEPRLRRLQRGRRDEVLARQPDVGGVLALARLPDATCAASTRGRSATRVCRSARSIAPSGWPAFTRGPLGDREREQRAGRLGAHDGRARRDQRPGELDRCGMAASAGRTTSAAGTPAPPPASGLSFEPDSRGASARPRPAATSAAIVPPTHHGAGSLGPPG